MAIPAIDGVRMKSLPIVRSCLPFASTLLAAALTLGCPTEADEGLQIGVLLPRTGQLADSGGHGESAVVMAAEKINVAGGLAGGKQVTLVVKDTRSESKFGLDAARKLLESPLLGLIGPEEEAVANGLVPLARAKSLVQISGGITSPRLTTIDDGGFFFRTCPSSQVTASAIARRMHEDGMRRVSMLYVSNDFGSTFVSSAAVAFAAAGGSLIAPGNAGPISVQPDDPDFRSVLGPLQGLAPDALLLVTDPVTGARLVQNWRLLGGRGRLYFAPSLMTEVFVREASGGLEGSVGVSAISGDQSAAFAQAYTEWSGELPAQAAYFYYDAMAVLSLAIEKAWHDAGTQPSGEQIRQALAEVSGPPGEQVRWDELGRGLELARAGTEIDYVGASGVVDLDANGDVLLNHADFWTVRSGAVVRE